MAKKEILDYIEAEVGQGKDAASVKDALLKVGWPESEIDAAFVVSGAQVGAPGRDPEVTELRRMFNEIGERLAKLEARADGTPTQPAEPAHKASSDENLYVPAVSVPGSTHAQKTDDSVESKITGKWFAGLGVVALLFGVGFFLKYAFENNLIGVTGRIVMGIAAGVVLLSLGGFLSRKEKYRQYSFFISGGGLGLLYLSVYAAFGMYHLISSVAAFALFIIISAAGGALSVVSDAPNLGGIALLGGFLTPFLVSNGMGTEAALFGYVLVLNLGFLGISFYKKWLGLHALNFAGTAVIFGIWWASSYAPEKLWTTMAFLTLFYLVFLVAPFLRSITKRAVSSEYEVATTTLNGILYFLGAYALLKPLYEPYLGFFFVVWAVLHLILAHALAKRNPQDRFAVFALAGLGLALAIAAVPVEFHAQWITIAWAAEAVILAWGGLSLKNYFIRVFAYFVSIFVVIRLLFVDSVFGDPIQSFAPIVNIGFLTFLCSVAAFFVIAYLLSRRSAELEESEKSIAACFGVAGNLFAVFALSRESILYFGRLIALIPAAPGGFGAYPSVQPTVESLKNQRNLSLSIIWGLYAGVLMLFGILRRVTYVRILAILGFAVVVIKVFLYDSAALSDLYRIISFLALGVLLLIVSFFFYRYKEKIKHFILA